MQYPQFIVVCSDYGAGTAYLLHDGNKTPLKAKSMFMPGDELVIEYSRRRNELSFFKNGVQEGPTLSIPAGEYYLALSRSTDFKCEIMETY
jgi:hypothetical protein